MVTVFWDSQDMIYIDYLEKGKTVTELYHAAELQKKKNSFKIITFNILINLSGLCI